MCSYKYQKVWIMFIFTNTRTPVSQSVNSNYPLSKNNCHPADIWVVSGVSYDSFSVLRYKCDRYWAGNYTRSTTLSVHFSLPSGQSRGAVCCWKWLLSCIIQLTWSSHTAPPGNTLKLTRLARICDHNGS